MVMLFLPRYLTLDNDTFDIAGLFKKVANAAYQKLWVTDSKGRRLYPKEKQDIDYSDVPEFFKQVDGIILVVDCISGINAQNERILRQAIAAQVKPVLFMNNIEKAILELDMSQEDLYQTCQRIIESINVIIATYADDDGPMGNIQVDPCKGDVAFGSTELGFAFGLKQFAEIYAAKFKIEPIKLMKRLWGDQFYNPKEKKWNKNGGEGYVRGFNQFILDPIYKMVQAIMQDEKDTASKLIEKLNIKLTAEEKELAGRVLLKVVMHKWLPIGETMMQMVVIYLPSPVTAERYRLQEEL